MNWVEEERQREIRTPVNGFPEIRVRSTGSKFNDDIHSHKEIGFEGANKSKIIGIVILFILLFVTVPPLAFFLIFALAGQHNKRR